MKPVFIALAACAALSTWSQAAACDGTMSLAEARKRLPLLASLPDDSFVRVVRESYYPEMTIEDFAKWLCVQWPPVDKRRKLGPIDQWRFESCQTEAAKAPTAQGVNAGLRVCRDKFGQ
jgi:hypothetical protein